VKTGEEELEGGEEEKRWLDENEEVEVYDDEEEWKEEMIMGEGAGGQEE